MVCPDTHGFGTEPLHHGFMVPHEASDTLQAELLRRIAEQDEKAVAELYDQVAGMLFSVAVRIVGDTHDAEEILQEVFVQIWGKAANFDPSRGTAIHWLLGITRNRSVDRLRQRQRRNRIAEKMTEQADITGMDSLRPAGHHLNGAEAASVHEAVCGLPQDQRVAIEMAFFDSLSHGEIAVSLGEPLGTVKARIRRGMMKLREHLKHYL